MEEGLKNLFLHGNAVDFIVSHCCSSSTQVLLGGGLFTQDVLTDYLGISADMLLGNIKNEYIRTREIRSLMKINAKEVAKATGIPLTRLVEIEAGEKASLAELRDIALCLSVSVRCLLGESFLNRRLQPWIFALRRKTMYIVSVIVVFGDI